MEIQWMKEYLNEAERLADEEGPEQALTLLNRLLYEEPGYARLHNHIGWVYLYHREDLAKAEMHLQLAVRFEPEFAPPYLHLGYLYEREKRYDEASAVLEKGLIARDANVTLLYEGIGKILELKKNYRRAIRNYRQALENTTELFDSKRLDEGIRRCRRKRWVMMFSF